MRLNSSPSSSGVMFVNGALCFPSSYMKSRRFISAGVADFSAPIAVKVAVVIWLVLANLVRNEKADVGLVFVEWLLGR